MNQLSKLIATRITKTRRTDEDARKPSRAVMKELRKARRDEIEQSERAMRESEK